MANQPKAPAKLVREGHGSDICYCGDYRSQHNRGPNKMCFCGCSGFHDGRAANAKDLAHWKLYHGPAAVELRREKGKGHE